MTLYDFTVTVMAAITSQDQRSYIKIECQRNKTAKEIFRYLVHYRNLAAHMLYHIIKLQDG